MFLLWYQNIRVAYLGEEEFSADAPEVVVQQPIEEGVPEAVAQSQPRYCEVEERRHLNNTNDIITSDMTLSEPFLLLLHSTATWSAQNSTIHLINNTQRRYDNEK